MINFSKRGTLEWVFRCNWCFGRAPILFKRWNPLFDAQRERLVEMSVSVHLLGLLPQL